MNTKLVRPSFLAKMAWALALISLVGAPLAQGADQASQASYVGSKACGECHDEQYKNYQKYAKKAHSFKSVDKMAKKLTEAELNKCYDCHTTGHGKPGGFISPQKTPHMSNAGCEVCHGPGSKHVASESAEDIKGKLAVEDCMGCHNKERVGAFRFRPLIYGGGH